MDGARETVAGMMRGDADPGREAEAQAERRGCHRKATKFCISASVCTWTG